MVCSALASRRDDRAPWQRTLDSLFYAARYDTLRTLLPGLIRAAEARGDSAALGRLVFQHGRVEITLGHQAIADRSFDRAIRLTEAARDTAGLCPALHFKAFVLRDSGKFDDAMVLFERELDLGKRAHLPGSEGSAIGNLAYRDLRRGQLDTAKSGFTRAFELYKRSGNTYLLPTGASGLGMIQHALGDLDSCRYWYVQCLRIARTYHYPLHELWALNNIGLLERDMGNQESAVEYYQAALAIGRRIGFDRGQALPLMNLSLAWNYLGEHERAQRALDEAIEVCRRAGFKDLEEINTNALANANLNIGRSRQAAMLFRTVVNKEFVFDQLRRNDAADGLAFALAEMDSVKEALRVLEPFVSPRVVSPNQTVQADFELDYAELLRRDGRLEEALARAVAIRVEMDRAGRTNLGVAARLIESSCRRKLGDAPRAATALAIALDSLEVARTESGHAEWREAYGQHTMNDVIEGCSVMLEYPAGSPRADRLRAFYDTLQRFKTRTLLERIRDPRGEDGTPIEGALSQTITVSRLQELLRPRELLLDLFCSAHQTYLFAVSREECRLVSLPGWRSEFSGQIALYADLLSASSRRTRDAYPPERLAATQRALGHAILKPVADLLAASDHMIVAADGCYASIPFGTLVPGDDGKLLIDTKTVVEVPSASVLEWARSAPAMDAGQAASMLAITEGSKSNLRGARHEVQTLERRYANVERVVAAPGVLDTLTRRAQPACILHVATHARVNDDSPWQSGFTLDEPVSRDSLVAGNAPAAGEVVLRAWEIARARMPYAMAVLAGCETAGGRATTGEGVLGLTSAFLSAGVPVVVSSRWPVDDRTTAVLMGHFYYRLSTGETVASALRGAQLAVRRYHRTSHPFYWAGFAVVGDGSRVVPPRVADRKRDIWMKVAGGAILAIGLAGWTLRRRRSALPTGT